MANDAQKVIYTIGHSTRELSDFVAMITHFKVEVLPDIRSLPGSTKFPQFNRENLEESLPKAGIEYVYLKELGGLRKSNPYVHQYQ